MPAAADVHRLIRLFAHFGNLRVAGHRAEEPIDVDAAPALREGDVLGRREGLVAEEDHTVVGKRTAQGVERRVRYFARQLNAVNFRTHVRVERRHGDARVALFRSRVAQHARVALISPAPSASRASSPPAPR